MANPEVCPYCGAARDYQRDVPGNNIGFDCLTFSNPYDIRIFIQSDACKVRQIAQLKVRVEKLERVRRIAEQFNVYNPDLSMKEELRNALKDLEAPNVP